MLLALLSACQSSRDPEPPGEARPTVIALSVTPARSVPPARLRHGIERECKPLARTRCDVREASCQQSLFELARCVSGRDGARPPLRFVAKATPEHERVGLAHHAGRGELERVMYVLGLAEASNAADPRRPGVMGAIAYYAPRERAVFFVHDDSTMHAGELAALSLVHEYVHALQDRDGALLAAQNGDQTRSFDQELALWSRFEGEATLYEELVLAFSHDREPETWLMQRFAARSDGSDGSIVRQRRPLEASFATFPYTYGAYWAALEAEPPTSTQQIMARRHDWTPAEAAPCGDEIPSSLEPEHHRRGVDTLGAWLVQTYVRRITNDPERARDAARRWRGDWVSFYSGDTSKPASFVWQSCWDSPDTAREMREIIAAQLRQSAGDRAAVTTDARRVTATVQAER
jgi:hypothetical protein